MTDNYGLTKYSQKNNFKTAQNGIQQNLLPRTGFQTVQTLPLDVVSAARCLTVPWHSTSCKAHHRNSIEISTGNSQEGCYILRCYISR